MPLIYVLHLSKISVNDIDSIEMHGSKESSTTDTVIYILQN